jgi:two-component system LytT family response regulator
MNLPVLRVLIADDELMARKRIRRMLSAIPNLQVVAEASSGDEALGLLDSLDIDLALLDIQMPGKTGLELTDLAAEWGVEVVFTTAHPEHAVEAFDKGVADYVMKPVQESRLATAISRVRQRLASPPASSSDASKLPRSDRLALSVGTEVRLVDPLDISHAEIDGELVTVWVGKEAILTDLSLQQIERKLPQGQFERVHRRALINLSKVLRLRPLPSGGYLAITSEGHEVPVSRQSARLLRKRLGIG